MRENTIPVFKLFYTRVERVSLLIFIVFIPGVCDIHGKGNLSKTRLRFYFSHLRL